MNSILLFDQIYGINANDTTKTINVKKYNTIIIILIILCYSLIIILIIKKNNNVP